MDDSMTLIITSYVISCICLIIVIINAFRISKLNRRLIDTLNQLLKLAKDCERMACLLEEHKYAIEDHNWALDVIYDLFNLQKDINFRVRNSIELAQWQRTHCKWGEDRMASIIHATFRTEPDQAPVRRWRKPKCSPNEQDTAKRSTKANKKSTKNCVK